MDFTAVMAADKLQIKIVSVFLGHPVYFIFQFLQKQI